MWFVSVALLLLEAGIATADADPSLATDPSPFVRRHAARPVPWRPWSDTAFERARRDRRPVFLLLGRASDAGTEAAFDAETAGLLSRRFVTVIADRDDRPDVSAFGRDAFELLAGGTRVDAGRALWLFLTPEGAPFLAEPAADAAALRALALGVAADHENKPAELAARGDEVLESLRELQRPTTLQGVVTREAVERALARVRSAAEGDAWSRPAAVTTRHLRLLLLPGSPGESLRAAARVLDGPAAGPRPEASLAESAQLLDLYLAAYGRTEKPAYRETAEKIASAIRAARAGEPAGLAASGSVGDDRVIAGWNGLAIGVLARSGRALERPEDLESARSAAAWVIERLGSPRSLRRCALGTVPCGPAFLEDYAALADGLLELNAATGDPQWIRHASDLVDAAVVRFLDPAGGAFYDAEAAHGVLPPRRKSTRDGALPSGNALLVRSLLRLEQVTGERRYGELARRTVEALAGDLLRQPFGKEALLGVAAEMAGGPPAATAEPPRPALETQGPVTVEAQITRGRVAGSLELTVRLSLGPGWSLVAHDPAAPGYVGLAVSVPTPDLAVTSVRYPASVRGAGGWGAAEVVTTGATVRLSLAARSTAARLARSVRVSVRFQACDARECRPPDSVVLDVPLGAVPGR